MSIRLVAMATIGTREESSEMYMFSLSRLIFSAKFRISRLELKTSKFIFHIKIKKPSHLII